MTSITLAHAAASRRIPLAAPERRLILLLIDELVVILAGLGALTVWVLVARQAHVAPEALTLSFIQSEAPFLLYALLIWPAIAWLADLYDITVTGKALSTAVAVLRAGAILFGLYVVIYFLSEPATLPRVAAVAFVLLNVAAIMVWRLGYTVLFGQSMFQRRILIVGAGWAGRTIARVLGEEKTSGYTVLGFIDDDAEKQRSQFEGIPVVGGRNDLTPLTSDLEVTDLILAITNGVHADMVKAMLSCNEQGVTITPMPILYEELTGRLAVDHVGQNWSLVLPTNPRNLTLYRVAKRLLDIILAGFGLALYAIAFPFLALVIRLDSPGPILYCQKRVGKGGNLFTVWKLRTMVQDAEKNGKAQWAGEDDPRITRVGCWLRRLRLDEGPQLFNVLIGTMSLIGPRPERPEFVSHLELQIPFYRARLSVLPGLTGWAQVKMGYTNTVDEALTKLQYDLYYIKHQTLLLDLRILFKTVGIILGMRGM